MSNIIWYKVKEIKSQIDVHAVVDDWEGFRIILKEEGRLGRTIRIMFDDLISFHWVDDSVGFQDIDEMFRESALCWTKSSKYIDWMRSTHKPMLDNIDLKHYRLVSDDECIDVLTRTKPRVHALD